MGREITGIYRVWSLVKRKERTEESVTESVSALEVYLNNTPAYVKIPTKSQCAKGYRAREGVILPWKNGIVVHLLCHITAKGRYIVDDAWEYREE